jgi:hypothetical protein
MVAQQQPCVVEPGTPVCELTGYDIVVQERNSPPIPPSAASRPVEECRTSRKGKARRLGLITTDSNLGIDKGSLLQELTEFQSELRVSTVKQTLILLKLVGRRDCVPFPQIFKTIADNRTHVWTHGLWSAVPIHSISPVPTVPRIIQLLYPESSLAPIRRYIRTLQRLHTPISCPQRCIPQSAAPHGNDLVSYMP